jgi:hypothetical protein
MMFRIGAALDPIRLYLVGRLPWLTVFLQAYVCVGDAHLAFGDNVSHFRSIGYVFGQVRIS